MDMIFTYNFLLLHKGHLKTGKHYSVISYII